MSRIALVKSGDRVAGLRRAIELLGVNPVRGNRVLLKPNFNSGDEAPGSTHPDVLRTLLVQLGDMGARAITVADRSGMGDTRSVMRQKGVFDLAEELGFTALALNELEEKDWIVRQSKGIFSINRGRLRQHSTTHPAEVGRPVSQSSRPVGVPDGYPPPDRKHTCRNSPPVSWRWPRAS